MPRQRSTARAEGAEDGADNDEDGALRHGRLVHEGRVLRRRHGGRRIGRDGLVDGARERREARERARLRRRVRAPRSSAGPTSRWTSRPTSWRDHP